MKSTILTLSWRRWTLKCSWRRWALNDVPSWLFLGGGEHWCVWYVCEYDYWIWLCVCGLGIFIDKKLYPYLIVDKISKLKNELRLGHLLSSRRSLHRVCETRCNPQLLLFCRLNLGSRLGSRLGCRRGGLASKRTHYSLHLQLCVCERAWEREREKEHERERER